MLQKNLDIFELRYNQIKNSSVGWTKYLDESTKKLYYKKEPGNAFITLFIDVEFEAPYMDLLLIFHEVDLYKVWKPRFKESMHLDQHLIFR